MKFLYVLYEMRHVFLQRIGQSEVGGRLSQGETPYKVHLSTVLKWVKREHSGQRTAGAKGLRQELGLGSMWEGQGRVLRRRDGVGEGGQMTVSLLFTPSLAPPGDRGLRVLL